MNNPASDSSDTVRANIAVHSAMAQTYNEREPHFRPENRNAVRRVLSELAEQTGAGNLIDIGCGTGFILSLAHDLFAEVHGVDVTPAMMERVDLSPGNIHLTESRCERLPFDDGSFSVGTAYSVLDHLEDYQAALSEVCRVLVKGGMFYADLLPNRAFWSAVHESSVDSASRAPWLDREVQMYLRQQELVEADYGVDRELFIAAEPWKKPTRGIATEELRAAGMAAGFSEVHVTLQWYLGQGDVLHGEGAEAADQIRRYLDRAAPLTAHLFKYLRVIMRK